MAAAHYLTLTSAPQSPATARLVDDLTDKIQRTAGRRKSNELTAAVGALVADLLRHPEDFHYRSLSSNAFTGASIGYRPCKSAIEGMKTLGFLDIFPGFIRRYSVSQKAMATRMRLRPAFLEYAASFKISPSQWRDHFASCTGPLRNENPVQLRAKTEKDWNRRVRGKLLPICPSDAIAVMLGERVNEINRLRRSFTLSAEDVEQGRIYADDEVHTLFFRGFNRGNDDGNEYGWDRGGRLYPLGGAYQLFSKILRSTITFNGEPSVEIDLRASHFTIYHGLNGITLNLTDDPYSVEGFPRPVVKAWVTMTLGHHRFHTRWHKDAVKNTLKKAQIDLRAYSIKAVQAAVLEKHPLLKEWEACPLDWGGLQYEESNVIVDTVHALTVGQGIPTLPVHDSIIVPISKVEIAKKVLTEMFEKHIGSTPALKIG